ncbi:tyrosine-type recombinase/integrase [Arthrobacter sp. H14]|uniref:tyrosine-type recombinase/integrase n=1 Tax=Arthrobacter sp. H14 TaxID=1312959 RepID=UPI0004BAE4FB|nr:tyrosine-type recombinase/integrase [Arthrobacter sp. H14]
MIGPDGVAAAAEDYLTYLEALNRSPHTIRAYASDIAIWFDFLHRRHRNWDAATMNDVTDFQSYLRRTNRSKPEPEAIVLHPSEQARSQASVLRTLTATYQFYEHHNQTPVAKALERRRKLTASQPRRGGRPVKSRPFSPPVPEKLPHALTEDELVNIVGAATRLRDRLLFLLMAFNGLRIGGALGLRHSDIDVRKRTLTVRPREDNLNEARAKRRTDLVLPLHDAVGEAYTDYLDLEYGDLDSDYVFVNLWGGDQGAPLTYDTVRKLIERTCRRAGVVFTAHDLRHTFAVLTRRGGASLESVSELLGHASVASTQIYSKLSVEDLRRDLDKADAYRRAARRD